MTTKLKKLQKLNIAYAANAFIMPWLVAWLIAFLASMVCPAQTNKAEKLPLNSLPTAETILSDWFRVTGGEENIRKIKDATYEWTVRTATKDMGRGLTVRKLPDQTREEFAAGVNVTNPKNVWRLRPPDKYTIINDAKAADQIRLQSTLEASYLIDLPKLGITARTIGTEKFGGEDAYAVEFSRANGSRIVWLFGAQSKLMLKVKISPQFSALYRDYKMLGGVLEPHTVELIAASQSSGLIFTLRAVKFNTGVSDGVFAIPSGANVVNQSPGAVVQ